MSKHTPGPWQVVKPAPRETGPTRIVLDGSKDHYRDEICVLYTNPDGSSGNADLIAAAPEMLETLKVALEYLAGHLDDEHEWMRNEILKTIAKAEGPL